MACDGIPGRIANVQSAAHLVVQNQSPDRTSGRLVDAIPLLLRPARGELPAFEERWTGGYIFENEWQSFRTRQNRDLELKTPLHTYDRPGRYTVAVKVIDIFGNDTMTLVPVHVG
jgi:hypothetical protein